MCGFIEMFCVFTCDQCGRQEHGKVEDMSSMFDRSPNYRSIMPAHWVVATAHPPDGPCDYTVWHFCSESCRSQFLKTHQGYIVPKSQNPSQPRDVTGLPLARATARITLTSTG